MGEVCRRVPTGLAPKACCSVLAPTLLSDMANSITTIKSSVAIELSRLWTQDHLSSHTQVMSCARLYHDQRLTVATGNQNSLSPQGTKILCRDRNPEMGNSPFFFILCNFNSLPCIPFYTTASIQFAQAI